MRKIILSILSAAALSASVYATDYEIRGEVAGLDGVTFYMRDNFNGQKIDSAVVENGKICFKGNYPQKPYVLITNNQDVSYFAACILDSVAVVDFKKHGPIEGSKPNVEYNDFIGIFKKYSDESSRLSNDLKSQGIADDEIELNLKQLRNKRDAEIESVTYNLAICNDNGLGLVATDYYASNIRNNPAKWDKLYAQLPPYVKDNERIKKMNELFIQKRNVMEGMPFLDFDGIDTKGQPVKLSDYVGKGKFVLVDAWSPTCGPCIREGREILKPLYEKYKDNPSFEILGIGVYDSKDAILNALEHLQYPWPQIIDSNERYMDLYAANYVPLIILFAPDGTILKRDLRGGELIRTVDELLTGEE